jgi:chemotaxis signal transduction protein
VTASKSHGAGAGAGGDGILAERARVLAAPLEAEEQVETLGAVLLAVSDDRYAVELTHVLAIERAVELTPVPGVPDFWSGIANIHGTLYPVLDLGRYLGAAGSDPATEQMLMLVGGAGIEIGLLVDEVLDVTWLRADALGPSPSAARGRSVVQVVTSDLVALLDLEALLSDPDLAVDDGDEAA